MVYTGEITFLLKVVFFWIDQGLLEGVFEPNWLSFPNVAVRVFSERGILQARHPPSEMGCRTVRW